MDVNKIMPYLIGALIKWSKVDSIGDNNEYNDFTSKNETLEENMTVIDINPYKCPTRVRTTLN